MPHLFRRAVVVTACGVAVAVLAAAPAGATMRGSAGPGTGQQITTAQIQPATAPATSAGGCLALVGDSVVVSWTGSTSAFTDGYQVLRSTTNGGPYSVVAKVGASARSYTDSNVSFSTTYYYRVRATKLLWTSAVTAQVQRATRGSLCL